MVIVQHTTSHQAAENAGLVGVLIFFVLSGFLITRLLLDEKNCGGTVDLAGFYARRARRLLPALGLALPLGALVNARAGVAVWTPVLSVLTYTANYASTGREQDFGTLTHLWSLSVEEHFYFVWPVVVMLVAPRRLLGLCLVGAVAVALARYVADGYGYRLTHLRVDAMLVGAGTAILLRRFARPPRALVWAAVPATLWFCQAGRFGASMRWGFALLAVTSAVLVADALHWHEVGWLRRVGVLSYGLYLFHLPVQGVLRMEGVHDWRLPPMTVAATLLLAKVSHRWVEMPLRARAN